MQETDGGKMEVHHLTLHKKKKKVPCRIMAQNSGFSTKLKTLVFILMLLAVVIWTGFPSPVLTLSLCIFFLLPVFKKTIWMGKKNCRQSEHSHSVTF